MSAPVLAHLNFEAPFILETNAYNYTTGAVLLQVGEDGLEHLVSFTNQRCSWLRMITQYMTGNFWLL